MMTAREVESNMLRRCAVAARSASTIAQNQQEANVFRVASMVIQSRLPHESARLMQVSDDYFCGHPEDKLHTVDVVRKGWVLSLPRLRDMLTHQLHQA
jgi:hypothetical protein